MSYNPNGYQNFQPVQDDYQLKYKTLPDYQYQQLYQQQPQQQHIQQQISQPYSHQLQQPQQQQQQLGPQAHSVQPIQSFQTVQQPQQHVLHQASQQPLVQNAYVSTQADSNALLKTRHSKDDLQRLFSVCAIFSFSTNFG